MGQKHSQQTDDIPEVAAGGNPVVYTYRTRPTIRANPNFDLDAACEELYKSMKGWGTDEDTLIRVLTSHSNRQRQAMKEKYMAMYGEDLVDRIKGEVDGHFQDLIIGLLTPTTEYEVDCLYNAMKGAGTSEDVLIEVLVGKSNDEIAEIKAMFEQKYEKSLDETVDSDLSGVFQNIIRALLSGARDEKWGDPDEATADAQELIEAGIGNWGTDESKFNAVLCARSFPHLAMVFRYYHELSGQDITESIAAEFSGPAQDALLAIVNQARDTSAFFAERLHNAMAGLGTTDHTVIRILVTRSEWDLSEIKASYAEMYEESLAEKVKGEARGDYETALLLVLGENPEDF